LKSVGFGHEAIPQRCRLIWRQNGLRWAGGRCSSPGIRRSGTAVGSVSQAAADTGRASNDILQAAVGLTKQGDALRVASDAFIARVRAA
jgi:hypothetical protein